MKETKLICKCGNTRYSLRYLGVEVRYFDTCPKCTRKRGLYDLPREKRGESQTQKEID